MASVKPGSSAATASNIWSLIISFSELSLVTPHLPMGKASPVLQTSQKNQTLRLAKIFAFTLILLPVCSVRKTCNVSLSYPLCTLAKMWNLSLPEAFPSCQLLTGISLLTCWYNYTNDIIDSDFPKGDARQTSSLNNTYLQRWYLLSWIHIIFQLWYICIKEGI